MLRIRQLEELAEALLCEEVRRQVRDGTEREGDVVFPCPDDDDEESDDKDEEADGGNGGKASVTSSFSSKIRMASLLRRDPSARPSAVEALKHPFIKKKGKEKVVL